MLVFVALGLLVPTAQTSLAETAETAVKKVKSGAACTSRSRSHRAPSQCRATAKPSLCVTPPLAPTAHTLLEASALTPSSSTPGKPATMFQRLPSQCSKREVGEPCG